MFRFKSSTLQFSLLKSFPGGPPVPDTWASDDGIYKLIPQNVNLPSISMLECSQLWMTDSASCSVRTFGLRPFTLLISLSYHFSHLQAQPLTAAMLFLSSLCRCRLSSSSLPTAYCSLSFFCRNLFNSNAFTSFPSFPPLCLARSGVGLASKVLSLRLRSLSNLPSKSSLLALKLSSRRPNCVMCDSAMPRSPVMAGVISSRIDC